MKKRILSSLLIIVLILPVTVFAQDLDLNSKQPADPNLKNKMESNIVAKVNGEKITSKELAQKASTNQLLMKINQIDQQFLQTLTSTESGKKVLKEYQKQQLDNLINNILLQQKAENVGITLNQKEKEQLYQQQKKRILKNNNLNQEKYLSILKNQGYKNEKEYKQQFLKNPQLKVNKLIEEKVVSNINVTSSEIKQFYEKNKEQFTKDDKTQPLEKVKPQIKELLKQQKRNKKISQYVKNIREKAEIKKNI
ncbi:SurA N-terminal domain-containing protein [Halanaerobium congolense]|uniref:SurA N-terminal domain-containing protein n=1 Tax=Halanaerobium congolense TaxID=54121 RepID=A0A1G8Q5Z2_9FIRM|nr:SurA N-terminal domain-containing protein [Halanaerobium congolense]SDF94956.1 SurA N-terminal domain-containing protein [Halanaerobium congolense]SDJ00133.1 SurA N-terminal domain-containing protein [Halanaerobium congolense]SDK81235.1 SurA N-terminal domain-containing protein [Halanaerobium congolense]